VRYRFCLANTCPAKTLISNRVFTGDSGRSAPKASCKRSGLASNQLGKCICCKAYEKGRRPSRDAEHEWRVPVAWVARASSSGLPRGFQRNKSSTHSTRIRRVKSPAATLKGCPMATTSASTNARLLVSMSVAKKESNPSLAPEQTVPQLLRYDGTMVTHRLKV
jgi:hypothetical protein